MRIFAKSVARKKLIMEMAERGDPRPEVGSSFNNAIRNYQNSVGSSYDPEFIKKLKEVAPHWFQVIVDGKKYLIEFAKTGMSRKDDASANHYFGIFLYKGSPRFDPKLAEEIKLINPSLFYRKKTLELLELAKSGAPKPRSATNNYSHLWKLTNKNHRRYNQNFVNDLKKYNPSWLLSSRSLKKLFAEKGI